MRTILKDFDLDQFNPWAGAVDTVETIKEHNKVNDFNDFINETHPEGIEDIAVNDLLWNDSQCVLDMLGIDQE